MLPKSSTSFYETCEPFENTAAKKILEALSCWSPLRAFLRHLIGVIICRGVSLAQLAKLCDLPNLLLHAFTTPHLQHFTTQHVHV